VSLRIHPEDEVRRVLDGLNAGDDLKDTDADHAPGAREAKDVEED
jgi:hypothetical protein